VVYSDYLDGTLPAPVVPDPANAPNISFVRARAQGQRRDDNAPRPAVAETVAIGAAHQLRPMIKMKTSASGLTAAQNTGWDINLDGLKHIGLYPDFFQDARNVGVTWEQFTPLFNASDDYVQMWERSCTTANAWRQNNNLPVLACK
jgi:hypothetical protein